MSQKSENAFEWDCLDVQRNLRFRIEMRRSGGVTHRISDERHNVMMRKLCILPLASHQQSLVKVKTQTDAVVKTICQILNKENVRIKCAHFDIELKE
jgi:hypothetical protein